MPASARPPLTTPPLDIRIEYDRSAQRFMALAEWTRAWWAYFSAQTFPARLQLADVPIYPDNATALAAGLKVGALYRTGADPDPLMIVH